MENLTNNNLLSKFQHGFIKARSCTTQLLAVLDDWTDAIEQGENVDATYIDYAKAFDTVPHRRLLTKRSGYGIGGKLLKWIAAFLEGRRQRVIVNGSKSSWTPVTSGIPQGSVLGPLLFVCYINDMPENITSTAYMFADDTKVCRNIRTHIDREVLQSDLRCLEDWSRKWQLRFNAGKCKLLHIGRHNVQYAYYMDRDTKIGVTTNERYLGVQIDPDLKFNQHVETVTSKANRMLEMIRRAYTYKDGLTIKKLYISLIRPILEYGNAAWVPSPRRENVQRRATKMVPKLRNLEYTDRLRVLKLPSRARGDMIEVYKYLHGKYNVEEVGGSWTCLCVSGSDYIEKNWSTKYVFMDIEVRWPERLYYA